MRANATIFGMIVFVPFLLLSSKVIYEGHQVAFAIASLVLISSLIKNRQISIFGYYIAAYVATDFVRGMLWNVNPYYPYASLGVAMFIILGMLLIYGVMQSSAGKDFFFNAICILSILQIILSMIQAFTGSDPYIWALNLLIQSKSVLSPKDAIGTMGNNNYLAGYLSMAFPLFLRKKWAYAIPAIVLMMYLCKTSTAIAAIGCAAAYYLWGFKKYRLYLTVSVLVIFVGYILISEGGLGQGIIKSDRWSIWAIAVDRILSSPWSLLFGQGLGGNTGVPYPLHNEWLQATFHLGLIGTGIIAWFFVSIKTDDRLLKASSVAIVVDCLGNHPIHLVPSAILILVVLALIARDGVEKKTA
jgi:hypothetical protein